MGRKDLVAKAVDKHYDGSISDAARRIGISNEYLGRVIRGQRQPTEAMATKIALKLGLSLNGVLGGEPPAETRSERMTRRRRSDKKLLRGLAAVHKTEEYSEAMRRAARARKRR
jgi:transcriptional regulator with XRE-family HTH domain